VSLGAFDVEYRAQSRGIGDLLGDLGGQASTLIRKEIDLARVEITSSVGRAGRGAAITAAGAALLFAGLLLVLASATLGLIAVGIDPWLAALIVGGIVLAVGAFATSWGVHAIQATDLAPRQAAASIREDVEFLKEQIQ
jgi:hypothetical protein